MSLDFMLKSEVVPVHRRSFELDDPTLLVPTNANPLVLGEFLQLTTSYKMARGSGAATAPSYCYFAEQGRYETQAIGKGPFLYMGPYEADTKVFDATGLTTVGQDLMVTDVTYGGIPNRRGLKLEAGGVHVIGKVTRLPANNNQFLRFMRTDA